MAWSIKCSCLTQYRIVCTWAPRLSSHLSKLLPLRAAFHTHLQCATMSCKGATSCVLSRVLGKPARLIGMTNQEDVNIQVMIVKKT